MNSHLKKGGITMKQKGSCFLPVVLSAALVLLIVPMIVSAEHHNSPGTVYTRNNAPEPDGNETPDYKNLNFNSTKPGLSPRNAPFLRRAWETFDDDKFVSEPAPTGFVLESVLGLEFPSPVVGVIGSPIIRDDIIYYVDELGTVFARDARSGLETDATRHWTTTLVDPDFENNNPPVLPELIYTTPIVSKTHVWVVGSVYGQLHRLDRDSGSEFDFNPSTPEVDPFQLVEGLPFSSVLGDAVIVEADDLRNLLVVSINVILNDAVVQGEEGGLQIAYDITNPDEPVEKWRRPTIDVNPATGLRYGSGVSAGSSLAVDYKRGYLFGGTGQNTTEPYAGYPDPELAPEGYVDRSDSLYAVDFNTGEFVWTNQFHAGDVFNLNEPVSTGPNRPDGPRDADVLSRPVLFSARIKGHNTDLVGNGSKGGLFRAVDRDTGETVWERVISLPTGIGGIQGGAAVAEGVIYLAGFEGIDDGFSDAQFGVSLDTGKFANAFFATFSPAFWADVEDTEPDSDPATGMRIKVYALNAKNGESQWRFPGGRDFVELRAGAALRHVSVANGLLFVTSSAGRLFVLDARKGEILFADQTPDLNEFFDLGLGKPHHAGMNSGTLISKGMVYVPYGNQNHPSGGIIAYEINHKPRATDDRVRVSGSEPVIIDALDNDSDPNGDRLRFSIVGGQHINQDDGRADKIELPYGQIEVFNPGDDPDDPEAAYLKFAPSKRFRGLRHLSYQVEDIAPNRVVNGIELDEPEPSHRSRAARAHVRLISRR
jgi:outer membrane protein assembly factor BamB